MLAIIKTGGKQYQAEVGSKIRIEKIDGEEGEVVKFTDVLLLGDDKSVKVGQPMVKGATVEGKIVQQGKAKKVWGIKHKAKKRQLTKFGHRQPFTEVEITKVGK